MATDLKGLTATTQPVMPFWWFVVQCVTCVLGLAIFIVACYCIHVLPGGGPQAFLLFDALMIWAVVGGFLAIQRFQPSLYYRIAFIASYGVLIVFVLSAWAWSASSASAVLSVYDGLYGLGSYYSSWKGLGAGLAVGAALGAIVWVLLIVSLVFFVIHSLRDGGDGVARGPDAEMGNVKVEQPAVVSPQQSYAPEVDYTQQQQQQQQYEQYPPQQEPQQYQHYPPQQQAYPQNPQQGPYNS